MSIVSDGANGIIDQIANMGTMIGEFITTATLIITATNYETETGTMTILLLLIIMTLIVMTGNGRASTTTAGSRDSGATTTPGTIIRPDTTKESLMYRYSEVG